jgi:hypothetical protein
MSALDSKVYVLTASGISLAGIVGVFTDEETAHRIGREVFAETDGYHTLEVRPMTLDVGYPHQFSYGNSDVAYVDETLDPVVVVEGHA